MSKKNGKQILFFIILGVIGMIGGFLGVQRIDGLENDSVSRFPMILFVLCAFALTYFLAIIIHEAGHLVMGLLTGYEFVSFRIGSFTVVRENGKLVRRKFNIAGTGGQCILTHEAVDNPQNLPYFWYHFGGVFFNFLTAVLCLPVIFLVKNPLVLSSFFLFAVISTILGILNIMPTKAMGIGTDGYNILLLRKSPVDRVAVYKTLIINGLQYQGIRPEDMPSDLLTFSESEKECAFGIALAMIEASLLVYRHDFQNAEEKFRLITENKDALVIYQNECKCEMMFCMIMNGCPSEEINGVYDSSLQQYVKATEKNYITRKRLMYAYYLMVEKNKEKAAEEYASALKMEKTYPAKGEYLSELDLMNYVKDTFSENGE